MSTVYLPTVALFNFIDTHIFLSFDIIEDDIFNVKGSLSISRSGFTPTVYVDRLKATSRNDFDEQNKFLVSNPTTTVV